MPVYSTPWADTAIGVAHTNVLYVIGLVAYTAIVFFNGGNLLRLHEESAYIAAGLAFLPGTINSINMTTLIM